MDLFEVQNQLGTTDRNTVIRLIQENGSRCDCILKYVSSQFKSDRGVVEVALEYDARSIQYASDDLRNDYEIALSIVKRNGRYLQYLGDKMRLHSTIVIESIRQHADAIYYVPEEMYTIPEIEQCARCHGF